MNWKLFFNTLAFVLGGLLFFTVNKKTEIAELSFSPRNENKTITSVKSHHKFDPPNTKNTDIVSQAAPVKNPFQEIQEARRERSVSNRKQWDEKKKRYSDFTLYFIDRQPREMAEDIINAYR